MHPRRLLRDLHISCRADSGGRTRRLWADARANSLMVRSGDFLRVPFFLRKNGHESIDSLYTLREFALALDDFAGLDAAGADADALASAVDLGLDGLEVHVPAAAGGVVGVRDVVAELRAFAAKITFVCHDLLQS